MSRFCFSKLVSISRNFGKSLRKEKLDLQVLVRFGPIRELLDTIELGLSIKFGINGIRLLPTIRAIENMNRLEMIKEAIKATDKLKEIEAVLKD